MSSEDAADLEKQPLSSQEHVISYNTVPEQLLSDRDGQIGSLVHDPMSYNNFDLLTWHSLTYLSMTVWARVSLWLMFFKLLALSLIVAIIVLLCVEDPAELNVQKFIGISKFLNTFVALLLGFFMSASIKRWWACADGFLFVVDAIRNLQIQFHALGVPESLIDDCLRYGVMSSWLLHLELHIEAMPDEEKDAAIEQMWRTLRTGQGEENESIILDRTFCYFKPGELEMLQKVGDPSQLMWVWVAQIIGNLAEQGEIPPMSSPTYGRIMVLAETALSGIRQVRTSITVQAPFIYVQMLASLVHINNIVNALSFGMTAGTSIGTVLASMHVFRNSHAEPSEALRDVQALICSFFFSCFGPFVYQALLETATTIAQPFNSHDGAVPTHRMLKRLERDMRDGQFLARHLPWDPPEYKQHSKDTK